MEAVAHQTFIPIVPRERIELGDLGSPWWNHDFLSDETCIGDSGDFDDGRVVTMKKKSLMVDAQPLQSDRSAQKAQEQTRTVDFSVLVAYQIPIGCGRSSSD
ncbi:MAG: hypothetical protein ACRD4C_06310 [Candidatus Acidiferrales bacterium]